VATIGAGYYAAPDGHRDSNLNLGAAWYLTQPLVIEAGVRFNRSNPGRVGTHQQFIAVTAGRNRADLLVGRVAWGSEGYLPLSPGTSLVGYNSTEFGISWRHWLSKRMGLLSSLSHYRNPIYERTGIDAGVFLEFD
jgi:YaiO family outer membrane protein